MCSYLSDYLDSCDIVNLLMVYVMISHYGTETVCRAAIQPGMLIKHADATWTASANVRGRLYLHRGIERTYTKDLLVEVYLDGLGGGLKH